MQLLETSSGDLEMTSQFGNWKRLPRNECRRVCQRLWQLLEVTATAGRCGEFASEARNTVEIPLSILIIFPHNSNKPRPQTESYVFSIWNTRTSLLTFFVCFFIIIIKRGWQCKAERVIYSLSVQRPQPHQPINRKKRKGKRVEDYSRDRAA